MPFKKIRVKPTTRHTIHGVVHVKGYTKTIHVKPKSRTRAVHKRRVAHVMMY